jgi:signal peptidase I
MILKWFLSKTVREAKAMRQHVWKILQAQCDILSPQAVGAVTRAMNELRQAVAEGANKGKIRIKMEELEFAANQWLKPYPHAAWRENVEVLLVALTVAMGIRTFFLQPFKIPTGSLQPTLWGVTSENLMYKPAFKIPTGIDSIRAWFHGDSYVHVVAKTGGPLQAVEPPLRFLIFNIKQTLVIGGVSHTIWLPPDYGAPPAGTLEARAALQIGQSYRKGEDVVRLRVRAGDHLFVNRITYNFRRPRRGEIIVFETRGIEYPGVPQDQFYIKRLVALGDDHVKIGGDQHLRINGRRLDARDPGFENVYSFKPNAGENEYFGHVLIPEMPGRSSHFSNPDQEFTVQPGHYMVMGDNTRNSLDSRFFGDFSEKYVIGKGSFVYWPISSRFGWGYR